MPKIKTISECLQESIEDTCKKYIESGRKEAELSIIKSLVKRLDGAISLVNNDGDEPYQLKITAGINEHKKYWFIYFSQRYFTEYNIVLTPIKEFKFPINI